MINPFFDRNRVNLVVQTALDGYQARHRAIVHNIANVDTPGYHRIQVDFEDRLKQEIKSLKGIGSEESEETGISDFARLKRISPIARSDNTTPLRVDGSNVGIDLEMAELSKNSGKINALTELLIRNYRDLKIAIQGR
jgi:flagellar basal-body rod protein FlgB